MIIIFRARNYCLGIDLMYKEKLILLLLILPLFTTGCAAIVGAGTIGTIAAVSQDPRSLGTIVEDQSIELKIAKLMFSDEEINDSSHINATSYKRVVLVTGETPTEAIRERIIDLIRNVEEVAHVYDELAIAAPSSIISRSSDSVITTKLKAKLLTMEESDGTQIKVVTERGIVYLMGLVTRKEGDLATKAAQRTGGVQKVVKLFQYTD